MKQLLKILILILILCTFYSCEKDDELIEHEHGEIIPNPKSDISFNKFLDKVGLDYYKNGNKTLNKYHFGYKSQPNNKNTDGTVIQYIDTTNIVAFEFDHIQSYTFNAVPVSDTLNQFYNVIFYQNDDGLQSKLLKYEPDFDFVNSTLPFSGLIHEVDAFGNIVNTYTSRENNSDGLNKNMTPCAFSVSTVNVTCTGHDQNGDPQNHTSSPPCQWNK